MKIPDKLPQFNTQKALIIVNSRQDANFFTAFAGKIDKLLSVKVPKPHYSDREGFFIGRNKNLTYRSGAVYELSDRIVKHDFFQAFKDAVRSLLRKTQVTHVYLFSPNHMITETKKILQSVCKRKVSMSIIGNYVAFHPLKLLKKIDERFEKKVNRIRNKPLSEEEEKILWEAELARRVHGGR